MEPYWHRTRIDQVIGRAIRICSHKDLPIEERHVDVFLYLSIQPKGIDVRKILKEEENNEISVRTREGKDLGNMTLDNFKLLIDESITKKGYTK